MQWNEIARPNIYSHDVWSKNLEISLEDTAVLSFTFSSSW